MDIGWNTPCRGWYIQSVFGYQMKHFLLCLIYDFTVFGWQMKHSFDSRILLLGVLISDKTLFLVFNMWLDGVWISDQTGERVSFLIHLIHSRKKVQKNEILISVKCVFISVLFYGTDVTKHSSCFPRIQSNRVSLTCNLGATYKNSKWPYKCKKSKKKKTIFTKGNIFLKANNALWRF